MDQLETLSEAQNLPASPSLSQPALTSSIHLPQADKAEDWNNWKWQQRNVIRTPQALAEALPDLPMDAIVRNAQDRKIQITPYYLRLIQDAPNAERQRRLINQVVPYWNEEASDGYNGETENWELSHEMKTPICQHKYDNRVILRMANVCNSYCQFCFEALRTINTDKTKPAFSRDHWQDSLDYIKATPDIEEVIFSGGDPLMLDDKKLIQYLADIRALREDLLIRVHSRALTFNPYRITDNLLESFSRTGVNAFGVHVCHPDEISQDFIEATRKIRQHVPILFANIPVLKHINDDYETLTELFRTLYRHGIVPYYLYHFMPFSPGSSEYRASVQQIIDIMARIKRRKSNIMVPEYVLPHMRGKFTVPLISDPADYPAFVEHEDGSRHYRFTNWLGETCDWRES